MRETVLRAFFLWIIVFAIVQPLISQADHLLDMTVKSNCEYMAQKAATDGTVSSSLKQEVIDNLKAVGFSESDITTVFDTTIKDRRQRIDVKLTAKRSTLFAYTFSSLAGPSVYYAHNYIMSEYLE